MSTSYVERQNLIMRIHMRCFTRLTTTFSKKIREPLLMVALYTVWYNFVRQQKAPSTSPRYRSSRACGSSRSTGPGLAALGATAAVAHGPYRVSRAWGRALFGHNVRPDGIRYHSRLDDGELCLALFDRCARHLRAGTSAPLLNDWSRFEQLVERYRRAIMDEI